MTVPVAAWVSGFAGLGAAHGLGVWVVYGLLALVGTLPGALTPMTEFWERRSA